MTTAAPVFAPSAYTPDAVLPALTAVLADDPLAASVRDPRSDPRDHKVATFEDLLPVGFAETYSPYRIRSVAECEERLLETKRRQAKRLGMHHRLLYTVGPNKEGWAHAHCLFECGWQLNDDADVNDVRDTLAEEYKDGHIDLRGYRYGGGWVRYVVEHASKTPWAESIEATLVVVCPGSPECTDGCRVTLDDPQFQDPNRYRAAGIPARLVGTATALREQVALQKGTMRLHDVSFDAIAVDLGCALPGTGIEVTDEIVAVLRHLRAGQARRSIAAKLGMGRHRLREMERSLRAAGLLAKDAPASVPVSVLRGLVRADAAETSRSNLAVLEEAIHLLRHEGVGAAEICRRLRHDHPTLKTSERSVRRFLKAIADRDDREASRPAWAIVDGRRLPKSTTCANGSRVRPWVLVMAVPSIGRTYAHAVMKIDGRTWSEFHAAAIKTLGVVPQRIAVAPGAVAAVRDRFAGELAIREYSEVARNHGFEVCVRAVVPETMRGLARAARLAVNRFDTIEEVSAALSSWCGCASATRGAESRGTLWKQAKVQVDNHFTFGGARYSVPSYLIGEQVEVSCSDGEVRAYAHGQPVAVHSERQRGRSTHAEHVVRDQTPRQRRAIDDLVFRARQVSRETEREVRHLLAAASFTVACGRAQAIIARDGRTAKVVAPPALPASDERHRLHAPANHAGVVRVVGGFVQANTLSDARRR